MFPAVVLFGWVNVMNRFWRALSYATALFVAGSAYAQSGDTDDPSPIVFIYDSSNSMWGQIDGTAKVEIAREVMATTVGNLPEAQKVGLVAYGHRTEGDCEDVETLLVNADKSEITPALEAIRPLGKTPLAWSATQVIQQLERDEQRATVILLTDGVESCGGNLCEVVQKARGSGVDFVMHIVGFGLQPGETAPLVCAAEAGGGKYFDAANADELAAGLNEATAQTVDLEVNVSLSALKNGEPLDTYVQAFPAGSSEAVQAARSYHKGARFYLPPGTYDLKVTALENTNLQPIWLRGIEVRDDEMSEHVVSFDAGTVRINVLNNGEGWDSVVKLYAGEKVVAQGRTYGRPKELQVPPGEYSASVTVLAVKGLTTTFDVQDINVTAAEVIDVIHPFETGIAMVGVSKGDELVDATVNFTETTTGKRGAGSRTYTTPNNNPRKFVLTPGTYNVKYVTLGEHKGHNGTFEMTVLPGETVEESIQIP